MYESENKSDLLEVFQQFDLRGGFTKIFPTKAVAKGQPQEIREVFFSSSRFGAIRGMHFQKSPIGGSKLVSVALGEIFDVVVDLREGQTFGNIQTWRLSDADNKVISVPRGFAHGFQSLTPLAVVIYATDFEYSAMDDQGVKWNSIGVPWPLPATFVSERDANLPDLADIEKWQL